jgi:glutamate synthase (NADPH/NADH) small chain
MEEAGIEIICNTEIKDVKDLLNSNDAIVMTGGSTIPRDLPIKGREANGVHFAMDFLRRNSKTVQGVDFKEEFISAKGKNVVVIGGGDTGSDCVGTSIRHGAKTVMQIELMQKAPLERNEHMEWPNYPMIFRTSSSQAEGCERDFGINTKEFIADEKGNLKSLIICDVTWEIDKATGRPVKFEEVAGTTREIPCELVTLAMGFLHPQHEGMVNNSGVELDGRKNVKAKEGDYRTSVPKIFAAGDMRRGQSLVVWAISEGRECARKVDEFLMDSSNLETKDNVTHEIVF